MEYRKKMALLIRNHLKNDLKSNIYGKESIECLEIAIDCINFAYDLNPTEPDDIDNKLKDTIKDYQNVGPKSIDEPLKCETITISADHQKELGNMFLKNYEYEKAIEAYSKSISINPMNAIYYCNRASGFTAVGKYDEAIVDCNKAIELDPTYSKAYSRQGLVYFRLKNYHKAVSCYKKACELDPQNVDYQRSYELSLSNLQAMGQSHTRYLQNEYTSTRQNHNFPIKCCNFL